MNVRPKVRVGDASPFPKAASEAEQCRISLQEYVSALKREQPVAKIQALQAISPLVGDIMCVLDALGRIQPAEADRPAADRYLVRSSKFAVVDPAVARPDEAQVQPTFQKILGIAAPFEEVLVIKRLEVTPANLNAMQFGGVEYKRTIGAWKELCPWLQGEQRCAGVLVVIENILLLPRTEFSVYGLNYDTCSRAAYYVRYESWLAN